MPGHGIIRSLDCESHEAVPCELHRVDEIRPTGCALDGTMLYGSILVHLAGLMKDTPLFVSALPKRVESPKVKKKEDGFDTGFDFGSSDFDATMRLEDLLSILSGSSYSTTVFQ